MEREEFEDQLDRSEHVVEWRRMEAGNESAKYVIQSTLVMHVPGMDILESADINMIWANDVEVRKLPDKQDDRGLITRWLLPPRKAPTLTFQVEL